MGKSSVNGPFSIAMLNYQRVRAFFFTTAMCNGLSQTFKTWVSCSQKGGWSSNHFHMDLEWFVYPLCLDFHSGIDVCTTFIPFLTRSGGWAIFHVSLMFFLYYHSILNKCVWAPNHQVVSARYAFTSRHRLKRSRCSGLSKVKVSNDLDDLGGASFQETLSYVCIYVYIIVYH